VGLPEWYRLWRNRLVCARGLPPEYSRFLSTTFLGGPGLPWEQLRCSLEGNLTPVVQKRIGAPGGGSRGGFPPGTPYTAIP